MTEYELYIPLTYNDGSPVEPERIADVKKRLHDRFGGLTFFPQRNEGLWKVGNVTFREEVAILRVIADEVAQSSAFLTTLKEELKRDLRQQEILIVVRTVEVL
jgi:hypothetical protein